MFVDHERYGRLFTPLLTIDLHSVDPAWRGQAHLISPIEPVEGYLGHETTSFHSYWARPNWIGFRLTADDRYEFLGDPRYFLLEQDDDDELRAYADDEHASLARARELYRRHGLLLYPPVVDRDGLAVALEHPLPLLDQLGGTVSDGWNWADPEMFPLDVSDEDDARPISDDGERFRFVAHVAGWNYRESGADSIVMFFEPGNRIVLFTFDWT